MSQAQHLQQLEKDLQQVRAEVMAQQLSLASMAAERDAARTSAADSSERLKVNPLDHLFSHPSCLLKQYREEQTHSCSTTLCTCRSFLSHALYPPRA
jgi:chlorite dismutase